MIAKGELSDEQVDAMHVPQHCKSPAEIFNSLCTLQISSLWQLEEAHYYQLSCDQMFQHNRAERQIDFLKAVFLNFEVWLKDFQDFDLRFGFSTPKSPQGQSLM